MSIHILTPNKEIVQKFHGSKAGVVIELPTIKSPLLRMYKFKRVDGKVVIISHQVMLLDDFGIAISVMEKSGDRVRDKDGWNQISSTLTSRLYEKDGVYQVFTVDSMSSEG